MKSELGEICEISAGYPFRESIQPSVEGNAYVIRSQDLQSDWPVNRLELAKIQLEAQNSGLFRSRHWIQGGEVLFLSRGQPRAGYIEDAFTDMPVVAAAHIYRLKPVLENVLPGFLVWQINHKVQLGHLMLEGSTVPSVRRKQLESLVLTLPAISIQEQVVSLWRMISKERKLYQQLMDSRQREFHTMVEDLMS